MSLYIVFMKDDYMGILITDHEGFDSLLLEDLLSKMSKASRI